MKRIVQALRERFAPSWAARAYHPDFADARLFSALEAGPHSPDLADACDRFHRGDGRAATNGVIDYFRRRGHPRFFVDLADMSNVMARIEADHPDWHRRTVERVRSDCDHGLPVFDTWSAPLSRADWTVVPAGPGDDVLYSVRPHFFEFAPRMAFASVHDGSIATVFRRLLHAWVRLAGAGESRLPYLSDLTAGLRVLALSWAWALLAGTSMREGGDHGDLEFTIVKILRADGEFLETVIDEATPNSHKLTAGFVLWYLGTLFPELAGSRPWRARGLAVWLAELETQTLADGGGFEHAMAYHRSVCEAASAFVLLTRRNGEAVPEWVLDRTRRAIEFQTAVSDGGTRPLGDRPDYSLFPLGWDSGQGTASLQELGRALFALPSRPGASDEAEKEQAFWLLGGQLAPVGVISVRAFGLQSFPESGCYALTSQEEGTGMLFRTGPRSKGQVFAGHMHADLLSIYLSSRSKPVVVEAGTGTYREAAGPWRRHLMGPESHNGLTIRGEDPLGRLSGDFRSRNIAVHVESRAAVARGLLAWVEGTVHGASLYAGHRRGVLSADLGFWIVYDIIPDGVPLADVSFAFQLEEGSRAVLAGDREIQVATDGEAFAIMSSAGLRVPSIDSGRLDPPRGWVSPRYGELSPAPQLRFEADGTRGLTAFVLAQATRARCQSISVERLQCGSVRMEVHWTDCTDHIVVRHGRGPTPVLGGEFDGTVLWLRTREFEPLALRWIDGRSARLPMFSVDIRARRLVESLGVALTPDGLAVTSSPECAPTIRWPDAVRTP